MGLSAHTYISSYFPKLKLSDLVDTDLQTLQQPRTYDSSRFCMFEMIVVYIST